MFLGQKRSTILSKYILMLVTIDVPHSLIPQTNAEGYKFSSKFLSSCTPMKGRELGLGLISFSTSGTPWLALTSDCSVSRRQSLQILSPFSSEPGSLCSGSLVLFTGPLSQHAVKFSKRVCRMNSHHSRQIMLQMHGLLV